MENFSKDDVNSQ